MKNSLNRSQIYEEIYQDLGNSPDKIFDSMKDVMLFCALIALRKGKSRMKIDKRGGDPIKLDTFRQDDKNIIDIIALIEYGHLEILTDEKNDEKLTMFEEYSNSGMSYLVDRFKGVPNINDILKLVDEFRPENKYHEPIDISSLVMEVLD